MSTSMPAGARPDLISVTDEAKKVIAFTYLTQPKFHHVLLFHTDRVLLNSTSLTKSFSLTEGLPQVGKGVRSGTEPAAGAGEGNGYIESAAASVAATGSAGPARGDIAALSHRGPAEHTWFRLLRLIDTMLNFRNHAIVFKAHW